MVNFNENFQSEKFKTNSPKRPRTRFNHAPKTFPDQNHQKFCSKLFNSQKTRTGLYRASSGQLNRAKNKRKLHRNPSAMVESSSLALPESIPTPIITCRMIASYLGRVSHPLGLVTPVTIMPKILFQKTWDGDLEWDDDVGAHIANQF